MSHPKHPVGGSWRGYINGHVNKTETNIRCEKITIELDRNLAWALCNLLTDAHLSGPDIHLEADQRTGLTNLGAAIGRFIDHPATNNGLPEDERVVK